MTIGHYVYLYRSSPYGPVKYVGYGMSVERAISHVGRSHNPDLRTWLEVGSFDLTVAGPYRDEHEAKCVEAALISALAPEFNVAVGDGPKFVPLGVPPELSDRPAMPPLSLADIGRATGGALLVYLAPGDLLSDGRKKFDPAHPDDDVIREQTEGVWDLGRHRNEWLDRPGTAPKILLGIHGRNVEHRFIAAAAEIDPARWFAKDLEVPARKRWKVPLAEPVHLDAHGLRGRRVSNVRFGQFSSRLHIWVDGDGIVRHPPPKATAEKGSA